MGAVGLVVVAEVEGAVTMGATVAVVGVVVGTLEGPVMGEV
jgi:hypothetical protein